MPWYLVWALPFVAVGRPRVLVPLAVVGDVLARSSAACPSSPGSCTHFGYFPTRLATGLANHDESCGWCDERRSVAAHSLRFCARSA